MNRWLDCSERTDGLVTAWSARLAGAGHMGVTMRKLIVSNLISLDGYASGPGGDVMALPFDTTFSDYNLELMQAADTLVSGATTRGFLSYWPPVADDPAQPEVERAISPPPRARTPRGLRHPDRRGPARGGRTRGSYAGTRHATPSPKPRRARAARSWSSAARRRATTCSPAGLIDELHRDRRCGSAGRRRPGLPSGRPARCG